MDRKVIITAAVTGSIPTKKDNPNLPITPKEIIEETKRSYDAGASVVHLHGRDPVTGGVSADINIFREYLTGIRAVCPIITQITTGGGAAQLSLTPEQRLKAVEELMPDSASLNAGSMNFGRRLFLNTPETMELFAKKMKEIKVMPEFEVYDLSMVQNVDFYIRRGGIMEPPYQFSFVMGVMGGIPPTIKNLVALKDSIPEKCTWQGIGIGRHQIPLGTAAILLGGNLRVGFEDNVYLTKGVLAKSNAELVEKAARIIRELGLEVATVEEARQILPLPKKE
ncbi:MAG: 3-keto-5-aminohexanoate cleavage enzyme [Syntrophaceae bacterium PtaU1.Bin231]|nr:MAG: 3-keto-5-aminohexanoate cleavage enzyme [Syntrophaceae bacterium PtaU1.Bin231]